MATSAGLKITIGADVQQAIRSIAELQADIAQLQKLVSTSKDPVFITKTNKEIASLQNSLKSLQASQAVNALDASLKKVPAGANQAGMALVNLGRVAQDAPFGFIGIQNNIAPLLESFQRLQQETGSTGGALKSLGSSLLGAAGVGLAISVVSGLVTAAIQKYGSLGNAIDSVFGLTSGLAQANYELAKSFAEAEGKAAGEVAMVNALVAIAQNKALADGTRQEAINKLNSEYDEYLPKLSLENINTDKVTASVKRLTDALVRQAKIRGAQDLISKETAKQLELLTNDVADNAGLLGNALAAIAAAGGKNFAQERIVQGAKATGKAYQEAQLRIEAFNKALQALLQEDAKAGTLSTSEDRVKTPKTRAVDTPGQDKQLIELKDALEKYRKQLDVTNKLREAGLLPLYRENDALQIQLNILDALRQIDAREVEVKVKPSLDIDPTLNELEIQKAYNEAALRSATVVKIPLIVEPVVIDVQKAILPDGLIPENAFEKSLEIIRNAKVAIKTELTDLNEQMRAILEQGAENAAASIGEAIGNIVSGVGGAEQIVRAFGSVIGDVLIQLGKMLVTAGITVKALKTAIDNLVATPGGAVAAVVAGVAAIAVGQALKNSFSNVKPRRFEYGGVATKPTYGVFGEAGPEAIIPLNQLPSLIGSAGGSGSLHITGQLTMDNRQLVANLARAVNSYNRANGL